jgi:hypothetical protein
VYYAPQIKIDGVIYKKYQFYYFKKPPHFHEAAYAFIFGKLFYFTKKGIVVLLPASSIIVAW